MVFSDVTIREAVALGRIIIDPFDATMVQPSSVDLRCDRHFRVFENKVEREISVSRIVSQKTGAFRVSNTA